MRDAGVHDASFHTLRHTAAAWMVQAGVSLYDVQNILGHSTPMMTTRYAHLQPDHLRRAVTALDRKLNSSKDRSTSRKTGE
jgi:integrase